LLRISGVTPPVRIKPYRLTGTTEYKCLKYPPSFIIHILYETPLSRRLTTTCTTNMRVSWCFSDRASWIEYILITNLMHQLLFIHKIIFSSTLRCVPTGHQELSYRMTVPYAARVQLYPPEDEHLRLETCRGE